VRLPPLRERPDDVVPLAEHFIRAAAEQLAVPPPALEASAREALLGHAFPGNVRELRNAVERAVLLCGDGPLRAQHLELAAPRVAGSTPAPAAAAPGPKLNDQVKALERTRVKEALEQANGNQTRAAELLGISRRSLIDKLEEFKLPRPRKKA
jgi:two-component system, NtrC family, response regulator AtoC